VSTPTIIKVASIVMKPRVATRGRNTAHSSLRYVRTAPIISRGGIEEHQGGASRSTKASTYPTDEREIQNALPGGEQALHRHQPRIAISIATAIITSPVTMRIVGGLPEHAYPSDQPHFADAAFSPVHPNR
jgi:hypothetical protein